MHKGENQMQNYVITLRLPDYAVTDDGFRVFQGVYANENIAANMARETFALKYEIENPGDIWLMTCVRGTLVFQADDLEG
jgi:hypothetical protein